MQKITSVIMTVLIIFLVLVSLIGEHGLFRLLENHSEVDRLKKQNEVLESEIADMKNTISAVDKSNEFLEKVAREELGLSKSNEVVYVFSPEKRADIKKGE